MCNVSNVSRQALSRSDGQVSAATLSILGEGIVGIVTHAPLWLLDRRNRGQMRTGSNRRHAGSLLCTLEPCVKLTKNESPCWGLQAWSFSESFLHTPRDAH